MRYTTPLGSTVRLVNTQSDRWNRCHVKKIATVVGRPLSDFETPGDVNVKWSCGHTMDLRENEYVVVKRAGEPEEDRDTTVTICAVDGKVHIDYQTTDGKPEHLSFTPKQAISLAWKLLQAVASLLPEQEK